MSDTTSSQSDSDKHPLPGGDPDRTIARDVPSSQHEAASTRDQQQPEPQSFQQVGDYEILSEIARGGMGVVYRARHRRLNRTVALKMILHGRFASDEEVRRFYQEAEAAARLDHSGIVPIYEIGEHEGHHFFSMKLIEGGSLAQRLPELRADLRAMVRLLACVSRAVHHAHQRGVLHRDIKPENILIDTQSGDPLITDLGLARQVEQDENLTRSGVVVGTPAYMPPEQAAGEELTTAADIYSMGAILYEILTGRPPFREATPVATLMKVIGESPAKPSDVSPRADRRLEAVCLKCLNRDPNDRYSSAAALADDLQAWLEGRPLSVRPPSVGAVLQTWFVNNLRSVGGALLVGGGFGAIMTVLVFYLVLAPLLSQFSQIYDVMPDVPRPLLAREMLFTNALSWMGDWMAALVLLPLGIFIGLINALVVRPRSRPAAIAAGLVASLAAIIIGFAGILGWVSLVGLVTDPAREDIRWLAEMALDDRQGKREESRRQLLFKYPDLRGMPPQQRATVIANLIRAEQVTRIPWALIAGLLVVAGINAAPILIGTMVAARLLQEKKGFWRVTFGYLEPLGVLTLLGFMLGLTLLGPMAGSGGYTPPPVYFAWLVVTFLVAIWGALARWTMIGRLLAHTGWIAAVVFLGIELKNKDRTIELANKLVYRSQYAGAADRLERYVRWRPWVLNERALLCLVLAKVDDSDRFRRHALEFMKECGTNNAVDGHHWAARISLLRDPSPRDVSMAAELAESATRPSIPDPEHWFQFSLALARYHQGRLDEALGLSEQCLQSSNNYCIADARVVRVLSLRSLGKTEDAQRELRELDQHVREHPAQFTMSKGLNWPQLLYYEVLRERVDGGP